MDNATRYLLIPIPTRRLWGNMQRHYSYYAKTMHSQLLREDYSLAIIHSATAGAVYSRVLNYTAE